MLGLFMGYGVFAGFDSCSKSNGGSVVFEALERVGVV